MKGYPDDATVLGIGAPVEADFGPLFGWPEAPPAEAEQEVMPLGNANIRGRYVLWRATPDGESAYTAFCRHLLDDLACGLRPSAKRAWELARADTRLNMDNSFHALAARDAETDHAALRGQLRKRRRKAS